MSDESVLQRLEEELRMCRGEIDDNSEAIEACETTLYNIRKFGGDPSNVLEGLAMRQRGLADARNEMERIYAQIAAVRERIAARRQAEERAAAEQAKAAAEQAKAERQKRANEEAITAQALQRADQLATSGKIDDAVKVLADATGQAGTAGSWACQVRVCELYHQAGRRAEVKSQIQHLFKYPTSDASVWERLAACASANEHIDETIQCNRRLLAIRKDDRMLLARTVEAAAKDGKGELANEILNEYAPKADVRLTLLAQLAGDLRSQSGGAPASALAVLIGVLLKGAGAEKAVVPSQVLTNLWASQQPSICSSVLAYLGACRNEAVANQLAAGFAAIGDADLRAALLSPLAALLGEGAETFLAEIAADREFCVRKALIDHLKTHPSRLAQQRLRRSFAEFADVNERAAQVQPLAAVLGPDAEDFLEDAARDPALPVQQAVLSCLVKHRSAVALGHLLAAYRGLADDAGRAALAGPLAQALAAQNWARFELWRPRLNDAPLRQSGVQATAPGDAGSEAAIKAELDWARFEWRPRPWSEPARERYVSALEKAGEWTAAIELQRDVFQRQPDNDYVRRRLAVTLVGAGKPADALALLEERLRLGPADRWMREALAAALMAVGKKEEGIAICREILAENPRDWRAITALSDAFDACGRRADAASLWRKALANNPKDVATRERLLHYLVLLKRHEEELEVCLSGLALHADKREWLMRAAELLLAGRRDEELLARLGRYASDGAFLESFLHWLFAQGRVELAARLLASVRPEEVAYDLAGKLTYGLYLNGQHDLSWTFAEGILAACAGEAALVQALVPFLLATLTGPDHTRRDLAAEHLRTADLSQVTPSLAAYSLSPDSDLMQRASALLAQVDTAAAERVLLRRLPQEGSEMCAAVAGQLIQLVGAARAAELASQLVAEYEQAGDWPRVILLLRFSLDVNPRQSAVSERLVNALCLAGQKPEAIAVWRAALDLDPSDVKTRENLGALLAELDRADEEVAVWQAGLALGIRNERWQMRVVELLLAARRDAELLDFLKQYAGGPPAYAMFLGHLLRSNRVDLAVRFWPAGEPGELRAAAAEKLGNDLYRDGRADLAEEFVTGLLRSYPSALGLAPVAQRFWLNVLSGPQASLRARAEKHLAAAPDRGAIPALLEVTDAADLDVRQGAIRLLHRLDPDQARRVLLQQLSIGPDSVKLAAIEMAVQLFADTCIGDLEAQWACETGGPIASALVDALHKLDPRPRTLADRIAGRRKWAS